MGIGIDVLAACGLVTELSPFFAKQVLHSSSSTCLHFFPAGTFFKVLMFLLVPKYCTAVARNETYAYVDGTLANLLKQLFDSFCTVRSFPFG